MSHLAKCVTVGLPVDIERAGVSQKMVELITETIRKPPINSGQEYYIEQSYKILYNWHLTCISRTYISVENIHVS